MVVERKTHIAGFPDTLCRGRCTRTPCRHVSTHFIAAFFTALRPIIAQFRPDFSARFNACPFRSIIRAETRLLPQVKFLCDSSLPVFIL